MDPLTLMSIIQGVGGIAQTIGGAIQRKKAEKAAQEQIGKLGPDQGILGYYNQALQRYQGLRGGEGFLQKQYAQQAQRGLTSSLRTLREAGGPGGVLAGTGAALRAANEGALKAAATGEQLSAGALGQLGGAAQMTAAEKRRPEELRLQMMLQKAAGGTDIANTGMSNIFGALQSYGTNQLYKDIYGTGGGTRTQRTGRGRVTEASLGSMGRTPAGISGASSAAGLRASASPSLTRGVSMLPSPIRTPYLPPYTQALNPVNYPF